MSELCEIEYGNSASDETTYCGKDAEGQLENARMQQGQKLIIVGFVIAVFGIVLYCMAAFSAGPVQDEPVFIKESLGVIGLGTLVWLVGAIKYLNGAIDSNTSDEEMF